MPPKKKKAPKNSFYFFMEKYRGDMERKGQRFPGGMKDVAEAAGPVWKTLSEEERFPYEQAAKDWKRQERGNPDNKYTSQGVSYAEVERRERERRDQEYKMVTEIESTVRALDYGSTLPTKPFYFIHLNYYCRTESDLYIPCEVALAEFTFMNGVRNTYHTIVDPMVVPLGYCLDAKRASEETHQIPLPPNETGERDYSKLFHKIKFFIQDTQMDDKLPPLYTMPKLIPAVKNFLLNLTDHMQEPDGMFRVYPLTMLFFELRNACASGRNSDGSGGFPVLSLAERELERDVFSFTPGISCVFHEDTDATQHCSLSYVKRWCYLIADHGCQDLDIELMPGSHIPMFTDTNRFLKATGKLRKEPPKSPTQTTSKQEKIPVAKSVLASQSPTKPLSFKREESDDSKSLSNDDLVPLRLPKTASLAKTMAMPAPPIFTDDDFPPIGASGVFGREPVVVAGRGRGVVPQRAPVVVGRGRGIAANFQGLNLQ